MSARKEFIQRLRQHSASGSDCGLVIDSEGFNRLILEYISIKNLSMENTTLTSSSFLENRFENFRANQMTFSFSFMTKVVFVNGQFTAADFEATDFDKCTFVNCHFSKVNLTCAQFDGCHFQDCTFSEVMFKDMVIFKCKFVNCHFQRESFTRASFTLCDFRNCNFSFCSLIVDFLESDFRDCNFRGADFTEANLTGSNLKSSDLTGVTGLGSKEDEINFANWLLALLKEDDERLTMYAWHCRTGHCLAGWRCLDEQEPSKKASTMIPTLAAYFLEVKEEAIDGLQRVASGEESIWNN